MVYSSWNSMQTLKQCITDASLDRGDVHKALIKYD